MYFGTKNFEKKLFSFKLQHFATHTQCAQGREMVKMFCIMLKILQHNYRNLGDQDYRQATC